MFKRSVAIFFAVALAGMVFFLTMLADPSDPRRKAKSEVSMEGDIDWNLGKGGEEGGLPLAPGSEAKKVRAQNRNRHGQLIELMGDRLTPEPHGVVGVDHPKTRIHLEPNRRIVEIMADRGKVIMPDNRPREGDFNGNVVLTLYESTGDDVVTYGDHSPHIAMRLFLEDASFDVDEGSVTSNGPVRLTNARFDFVGQGLKMNYNEVSRRVERLIITKGRRLRLARNAGDQPGPGAATQPAAAETARSGKSKKKEAPIQYYRATFNKNVVVTAAEGVVNDCDQMDVTFSIRADLDERKLREGKAAPVSRVAPAPAPRWQRSMIAGMGIGAGVVPQLLAMVLAQPAAADVEGAIGRSMMVENPQDIVITWQGRLAILPLDEKPEAILDKNDLLLTMVGDPVRIATAKRDLLVSTPRMELVSSAGRLSFLGSDAHEVTFNAEAWGILTTRKMVLDTQTKKTIFSGLGRWKSHGERSVLAKVEPQRQLTTKFERLPAGTELAWADRLEVDLYMEASQNPAKRVSFGAIEAVERATFYGDVNLYHPLFDLRGDSLTVGMERPVKAPTAEAGKTTQQKLHDVSVSGKVHVVSRTDDEKTKVHIQSDHLSVGLESTPDGEVRPKSLLADSRVVVRQSDKTLRCGDLLVDLVRASETGRTVLEKDKDDLEVRSITANQNVRIELAEQGVEIRASRMLAAGDQVEFFGETSSLVRMFNADGMLSGTHFVLDQKTQTLHAVGAGIFDVYAKPEAGDAAGADRRELLTATWRDNMHFDNRNNFAQFVGDVVCRAKRGQSTTQLNSDDLKLDFVLVDKKQEAAAGGGATTGQMLTSGDRSLHRMAARGNVKFLAANWASLSDEMPFTRITIEGPAMTFDTPRQQVQVLGKGRMGFEDYRTDKPAASAAATTSKSPLVKVTGQGATLITWTGQLDLDFTNNDMRVIERVQMLHMPLGGDRSKAVQMDCQSFLADLTETGGIGPLLHNKAEQPQLRAIAADGRVRVLGSGKELHTDHLDYKHADETMLLRADQGGMTRIIDTKAGTQPMQARGFHWDLINDRLEILDPGRSAIPVRRK